MVLMVPQLNDHVTEEMPLMMSLYGHVILRSHFQLVDVRCL